MTLLYLQYFVVQIFAGALRRFAATKGLVQQWVFFKWVVL